MGQKDEDLFPREEERKKKPQKIEGIPSRTNLKAKVRSKPKVEGQKYLDLYLMIKEKERLEKFVGVIRRMHKQTAANLKGIKREIAKVEKKLPTMEKFGEKSTEEVKGKGEVKKRISERPLKKVVIDY